MRSDTRLGMARPRCERGQDCRRHFLQPCQMHLLWVPGRGVGRWLREVDGDGGHVVLHPVDDCPGWLRAIVLAIRDGQWACTSIRSHLWFAYT